MSDVIAPKPTFSSVFLGQIGVWLTFIGVLLTAGISFWNAQQNGAIQLRQQDLNAQQQQSLGSIEKIKAELSIRQADLTRLQFVKDLLPDAMSPDPQKKATFLTLVELTLDAEDYRRLIAALASSNDPDLKEVGDSGTQALDEKDKEGAAEILRLVDQIDDKEKAVRLQAMDTIYQKFIGDTRTIQAVVDYLVSGLTEPLHVQGRINALYVLKNASTTAWTPALVVAATDALDAMEQGAATIGPEILSQTKSVLASVRARLAEASEGG